MRLSALSSRAVKDAPRDAELASHQYLTRAGYIRQYASGIYGLLPLACRSIRKIEAIVREEMDKVSGQEISMPCLSTKELWSESGRYSAIGSDMFRLQDRDSRDLVLNMTHEEPVVYLMRNSIQSYKQLPVMVYQIQNKYRDEPRPRGGLIRLREFTMKDGYSFHESEEDLKDYYDQVHEAYTRIFHRVGMKNFVSVQSDNGMFGGAYSHEFQLITPAGEDTLVVCDSCDYKANEEVAVARFEVEKAELKPVEKIPTPGLETIEDLAESMGVKRSETTKALCYQKTDKSLVLVFVRGDLKSSERKLNVLLQSEIFTAPKSSLVEAGLPAGSIGPVGVDLSKVQVVVDQSVLDLSSSVCGANEEGFHLKNINIQRDFLEGLSKEQRKLVTIADVAQAEAGHRCAQCEGALKTVRGIEVGNIFNLGTKYSEPMECNFLDKNGKSKPQVMGCYGIGVTRILPAVIEESHDDKGMILPITIAPYQVHLCAIGKKKAAVNDESERLYSEMTKAGIEVLFDDRDKGGAQFAEADLLGIPFRVLVSQKTLGLESVEFKYRDNRSEPEIVPIKEFSSFLDKKLKDEFALYGVL